MLAENAAAIRTLAKHVIEDVIEIGRRLSDCKKLLGYGNWLSWLAREFSWSERSARNFINCYELSQSRSENFADLGIDVSSLYLLAARSTPEKARAEVFRQAAAQGGLPHVEVKRIVEEAKGHPVGDPSVRHRMTTREVIEGLGHGAFAKLPNVERVKILEMMRQNITAEAPRDISAAIDEAERRQGWKPPYRRLIDALDALDALNPPDATESSSIKKVVGAFPLDDTFMTSARIKRSIEFLGKLFLELGPIPNESENSLATILNELLGQARQTTGENTGRPVRRRSSKPSSPK